MKTFIITFFLMSILAISSSLSAQDFKIVKRTKLDACSADGGWRFEVGKVTTDIDETVVVVFFAETKNGQWLKRNLRSEKNGDVRIGLESCELTGRYVHYAYYAGDSMYKHPTIAELLAVNGY